MVARLFDKARKGRVGGRKAGGQERRRRVALRRRCARCVVVVALRRALSDLADKASKRKAKGKASQSQGKPARQRYGRRWLKMPTSDAKTQGLTKTRWRKLTSYKPKEQGWLLQERWLQADRISASWTIKTGGAAASLAGKTGWRWQDKRRANAGAGAARVGGGRCPKMIDVKIEKKVRQGQG